MKKIISILCLTIGLFVSVTAFIACGDDDVNNGGNSSKHIVKIVGLAEEIGESILTYDSNERITRIIFTRNDGRVIVRTYQYSETQIICVDDNDTTIYTVENGLIVKEEKHYGDIIYYTYDNKGYLVSRIASDYKNSTSTITFNWVDGNMTSFTQVYYDIGENGSTDTRTLSYTNIPWQKGMIFYFKGTNLDKYLWLSGYWGKTPKYMPRTNSSKGGLDYDYTISDGLILEFIINGKTYSTFTWE